MKSIWKSKTFWVNVLAIASGYALNKFNIEIGAETQIAILGVINLVLRLITKEEIVW